MCTAYIEVFRGSPLFVLLLLANNALEFFVPSSMAPGVVVRAIVVFTLFTAAYLAEIVRGGLQSVPPGQEEAAKALGLSPVRTTMFLIVLPQALRNVIPAQIGQFISLFKDVALAGAAMGVFDLLDVLDDHHQAARVRRAAARCGDTRLRGVAVLGRFVHHVAREPAAREEAGGRYPMNAEQSDDRETTDQVNADATEVEGDGRGDHRARGRLQALRRFHRALPT